MTQTQMYLGDGLYAKFDGFYIWLLANGDGVHTPATDAVALEPQVYGALKTWVDEGFRDYNSGQTFVEAQT